MARVNLFMLMEILTKDCGQTTKQMVLELSRIVMVQAIKDFGRMITNMVKVKKSGPTVLILKESISMFANKEWENMSGLTVQVMMENGIATI